MRSKISAFGIGLALSTLAAVSSIPVVAGAASAATDCLIVCRGSEVPAG
jgi:hypothetical protein